MLEEKPNKTKMNRFLSGRVGVASVAGTVALLVGASITIFPQSHPRGLLGLAASWVTSMSPPPRAL